METSFNLTKEQASGFHFRTWQVVRRQLLTYFLMSSSQRKSRDETIICIDEPEGHIHTKLQGQLLEELYNLIPEKSQLWIATHSIGMVRKAQDLWQADPDSVVFLDFNNRNFDKEVTITPAKPNPNFWAQTYDVALGDLAKLVAPKRIILCEGKFEWATEGFDAACYNRFLGVVILTHALYPSVAEKI